jgi:hypothetical protein
MAILLHNSFQRTGTDIIVKRSYLRRSLSGKLEMEEAKGGEGVEKASPGSSLRPLWAINGRLRSLLPLATSFRLA